MKGSWGCLTTPTLGVGKKERGGEGDIATARVDAVDGRQQVWSTIRRADDHGIGGNPQLGGVETVGYDESCVRVRYSHHNLKRNSRRAGVRAGSGNSGFSARALDLGLHDIAQRYGSGVESSRITGKQLPDDFTFLQREPVDGGGHLCIAVRLSNREQQLAPNVAGVVLNGRDPVALARDAVMPLRPDIPGHGDAVLRRKPGGRLRLGVG